MTATGHTALRHVVRGAISSDQSYVGQTWTKSMLALHISERERGMTTWPLISKAIDEVMNRPETRVQICCAPVDRRLILGWVCYALIPGAPVVHYLYVRNSATYGDQPHHLRGNGIARSMLEQIGIDRDTAVVCTSLGPSSREMRSRYPASTYLPLNEYLKPGAVP